MVFDHHHAKDRISGHALMLGVDTLVVVAEQNAGAADGVPRTAVYDPVEGLAACALEDAAKILGDNLRRHVVDMLAAVAGDGLNQVARKTMKEAERMDPVPRLRIEHARRCQADRQDRAPKDHVSRERCRWTWSFRHPLLDRASPLWPSPNRMHHRTSEFRRGSSCSTAGRIRRAEYRCRRRSHIERHRCGCGRYRHPGRST